MSATLRPWRLGLTGGIGSGKSTVARLLVARGATLIDADALARACTAAGGAAIPALRAQFGDVVLTADGALDRAAMRARAFANPEARLQLEAIVHPLVRAAGDLLAADALAQGRSWLLYDIPLLAETAATTRRALDAVLVLDCSTATQVARTTARDGLSADAVQRIIQTQAPRATRRALADAVVHNDGIALDALERAADAIATWAREAAGYHPAGPLPPSGAARTPPP